MTYEELVEILMNHQKWLAGPDGIRADLNGADLRSAKLNGTNLSDANLRDANLSGADLNGADLRYADLRGADLRCAGLDGADLRSAKLNGANLSDADLRCANLSDADLRSAKLNGANLSDANLKYANLNGADLSDADLRDADLRGADLSGAEGILNPIEYIMENFERNAQGIIVYKAFGEHYMPNPNWEIAEGSIIEEVVNPLPTVECGCGVNVATKEWVKRECNNLVWECLIKWEWLPGVVVPYQTDGKIRASKVQLIKPVNLNRL